MVMMVTKEKIHDQHQFSETFKDAPYNHQNSKLLVRRIQELAGRGCENPSPWYPIRIPNTLALKGLTGSQF